MEDDGEEVEDTGRARRKTRTGPGGRTTKTTDKEDDTEGMHGDDCVEDSGEEEDSPGMTFGAGGQEKRNDREVEAEDADGDDGAESSGDAEEDTLGTACGADDTKRPTRQKTWPEKRTPKQKPRTTRRAETSMATKKTTLGATGSRKEAIAAAMTTNTTDADTKTTRRHPWHGISRRGHRSANPNVSMPVLPPWVLYRLAPAPGCVNAGHTAKLRAGERRCPADADTGTDSGTDKSINKHPHVKCMICY